MYNIQEKRVAQYGVELFNHVHACISVNRVASFVTTELQRASCEQPLGHEETSLPYPISSSLSSELVTAKEIYSSPLSFIMSCSTFTSTSTCIKQIIGKIQLLHWSSFRNTWETVSYLSIVSCFPMLYWMLLYLHALVCLGTWSSMFSTNSQWHTW